MAANSAVDPRRYFEGVPTGSDRPAHDPVCLYLETTNRGNLLCTTCPRTYEELEPPADMSWQLFCSIVDQIPNLARAVLHGVGEPMASEEFAAHGTATANAEYFVYLFNVHLAAAVDTNVNVGVLNYRTMASIINCLGNCTCRRIKNAQMTIRLITQFLKDGIKDV